MNSTTAAKTTPNVDRAAALRQSLAARLRADIDRQKAQLAALVRMDFDAGDQA